MNDLNDQNDQSDSDSGSDESYRDEVIAERDSSNLPQIAYDESIKEFSSSDESDSVEIIMENNNIDSYHVLNPDALTEDDLLGLLADSDSDSYAPAAVKINPPAGTDDEDIFEGDKQKELQLKIKRKKKRKASRVALLRTQDVDDDDEEINVQKKRVVDTDDDGNDQDIESDNELNSNQPKSGGKKKVPHVAKVSAESSKDKVKRRSSNEMKLYREEQQLVKDMRAKNKLEKEEKNKEGKLANENRRLKKDAKREEKENEKKKTALVVKVDVPRPTHLTLGADEVEYKVIKNGSPWYVIESQFLIDTWSLVETKKRKDFEFRNKGDGKIWLEDVPLQMARQMTQFFAENVKVDSSFGSVRLGKDLGASASSSPYKYAFDQIKRKVANYKASLPDGREEEIQQPVFPTGAGIEDGIEDARSMEYNKRKELRMQKADNHAGLYPEEGIKGELCSTSGQGRRRPHCDDTDDGESSANNSNEKRTTKNTLITKLQEQTQLNHNENKAMVLAQREEEAVRYQDSLAYRKSEVTYRDKKDAENKVLREANSAKEDARYQASLDLTEERFLATTSFNKDLLKVLNVMAAGVQKLNE